MARQKKKQLEAEIVNTDNDFVDETELNTEIDNEISAVVFLDENSMNELFSNTDIDNATNSNLDGDPNCVQDVDIINSISDENESCIDVNNTNEYNIDDVIKKYDRRDMIFNCLSSTPRDKLDREALLEIATHPRCHLEYLVRNDMQNCIFDKQKFLDNFGDIVSENDLQEFYELYHKCYPSESLEYNNERNEYASIEFEYWIMNKADYSKEMQEKCCDYAGKEFNKILDTFSEDEKKKLFEKFEHNTWCWQVAFDYK